MAEKRNGAGSRLAGLLERPAQPDEPVGPEQADDPAEPSKGRGGPAKKDKASKIKGRTIYLHDDLFERIIVQAHRRGRTISEYVSGVLERQVPDHRVVRAKGPEPAAETDAA